MSQDKQEQDFNEYLQGDAGLSSSYQKASSEQPPARLDDAILAASRRQLQSKPRYAFSPFASDWHVPLSLAAVVVLSVSVIVTMQDDSGQRSQMAPPVPQPRTASESFAKDFSKLDKARESFPVTGSLNDKEDSPLHEFDSDISIEAKPAAASVKPEKMMAGKAEEFTIEEENIPTLKQKPKTSSSSSVLSGPAQQSYVSPLPGNRQPAEQELVESDNESGQAESRFKQQPSELSKKRLASPIASNSDSAIARDESSSFTQDLNSSDSVVSAAGMTIEKSNPDDWLELIAQLWRDDKKEEALHQLGLFSENYPAYENRELLQKLDPELIGKMNIN